MRTFLAQWTRAALLGWLAVWTAASGCAQQSPRSAGVEDRFERARQRMVDDQLRKALFGRTPVKDEAVLNAFRKVPRHRFVPPELRDEAYSDYPLPIGQGQTISQPYIVALMTEAAHPKPTDKALEIGTGSGYQAAILAEIVEEVYTIEIIPELAKRAAQVLDELGYANVHTRIGDGYKGWPEEAPFDVIIVTAAPDHVPQPLVDQLAVGGRMVIPVGAEGGIQELKLLEKQPDGAVKQSTIEMVRFVPLTGEAQRN